MSLITCCPACGTMFKVVPDQLRISEGWVRCGHCAEVFDASSHLQGPQGEPAGEQPAAVVEEPAPPVEQPEPAAREDAVQQAAPQPWDDAAPAEPEPTNPPYPPFVLPQADNYEAEVAVALAEQKLREEPAPDAFPVRGSVEDMEEDEPELHDVSFVRDARRKAFWRRPMVRALLLLVTLGLAALLAGQYAVQNRDRLAAMQPVLRPVIEALCEHLHCSVGPPRQIEAIVIDSSTFSKLRGDAYRLSFTLRNQAAMQVAMPAVELTLTDSQDQPVLRRVLTPADMGAAQPVIAPASDWTGTLALAVAGNGGRVAGYRLLAFYP